MSELMSPELQVLVDEYLAAKLETAVRLKKLDAVFWPIFNELTDASEFEKALEFAQSMPESSLRMRAIGFAESQKQRARQE